MTKTKHNRHYEPNLNNASTHAYNNNTNKANASKQPIQCNGYTQCMKLNLRKAYNTTFILQLGIDAEHHQHHTKNEKKNIPKVGKERRNTQNRKGISRNDGSRNTQNTIVDIKYRRYGMYTNRIDSSMSTYATCYNSYSTEPAFSCVYSIHIYFLLFHSLSVSYAPYISFGSVSFIIVVVFMVVLFS